MRCRGGCNGALPAHLVSAVRSSSSGASTCMSIKDTVMMFFFLHLSFLNDIKKDAALFPSLRTRARFLLPSAVHCAPFSSVRYVLLDRPAKHSAPRELL